MPQRKSVPMVGSAMAASAAACLFSDARYSELAELMRSIECGDAPLASRIARRIVGAAPSEAANDAGPPARVPGRKNLLSPRELEVLRLIALGWSSRQIAEAVHRSIHTIETQVKSIYRKLAVKSRTQAVREATQKGLLTREEANPPQP